MARFALRRDYELIIPIGDAAGPGDVNNITAMDANEALWQTQFQLRQGKIAEIAFRWRVHVRVMAFRPKESHLIDIQ